MSTTHGLLIMMVVLLAPHIERRRAFLFAGMAAGLAIYHTIKGLLL